MLVVYLLPHGKEDRPVVLFEHTLQKKERLAGAVIGELFDTVSGSGGGGGRVGGADGGNRRREEREGRGGRRGWKGGGEEG